jgi:acetate kinase
MALLILNAGSSSLKFGLMNPADHRVFTHGTIELGSRERDADERRKELDAAVRRIVSDARTSEQSGTEDLAIEAVAHRVVHGGTRFTEPVRITPDVRTALSELSPLAPLHNPPSLDTIDAAIEALPDVPHVAVFDTAFHATLSPEALTYPLPFEWSERWGLRRFGFHGLSHAYCTQRVAELLGRSSGSLNVVIAHLGNGASVTATRDGMSVDTSMGFTPLEGLMMGTRSGSIDPGLLVHLQRACGVSVEELDRVLNHESGLFGVSGLSSDMRAVIEASRGGDGRASLAMRMFVHRARQTIGAMAVTLGRVDVLVFTGGIGEHSPEVRAAVCEGLSCLGLELDEEANRSSHPDAVVSFAASPGRILVLTTREDVTMARAVMSCIRPAGVHGASIAT